jgi:hypothetical protein
VLPSGFYQLLNTYCWTWFPYSENNFSCSTSFWTFKPHHSLPHTFISTSRPDKSLSCTTSSSALDMQSLSAAPGTHLCYESQYKLTIPKAKANGSDIHYMQIKRHFRKCSFRLGRFAVSKPDVRYQAERDTWGTFCKRVSHSEIYLCWDLLGPNEPFSGVPPFEQIRRSQQIRTHETLQPFLTWKYKIATTFNAPNDQASASAPAIINQIPDRKRWMYYCLPRLRGGQAWAQTQRDVALKGPV